MSTAIATFIPSIWAERILREKDKQHVLIKNSNRSWEGEIKGKGSEVTINSLNYPTIRDYTRYGDLTIENVKPESRKLQITEEKYFNVELDKVDKKQGTKGIMDEVIRKAAIAMVDTQEQFLATKFLLAGESVTNTSVTSANIYNLITTARRKLHRNNVTDSREVVLEVGPSVWEKIVLAGIVETDLTDPIKGKYEGYWSKLLGMQVYVSNNLDFTITSDDVVQEKCVLRTKEAVAWAEQIMDVERYRPESKFTDAVKGLCVYGSKEVKPKEMCLLDLKTAAES